MEKTIYECKKCLKVCNGMGLSFELVHSPAHGVLMLVMSRDMKQYRDHSCGPEHMTLIFNEAMADLKNSGGVKVAVPAEEAPAEEAA